MYNDPLDAVLGGKKGKNARYWSLGTLVHTKNMYQ